MHQQLVLGGIVGGKEIVAGVIAERHMHVHARARPLRIGLGHEGGAEAVLLGCGLDHTLQHDRLVAGLQHIGPVAEHDFHLSRRVLRDQRLGRQALLVAPVIEVLEEGAEVIRVLEIIGLIMLRARLVDERARRYGLSRQRRGAVHEEEFELDGAHGRHVEIGLEAVRHLLERVARIGVGGAAVEVVDRSHILRGSFPATAHGGANRSLARAADHGRLRRRRGLSRARPVRWHRERGRRMGRSGRRSRPARLHRGARPCREPRRRDRSRRSGRCRYRGWHQGTPVPRTALRGYIARHFGSSLAGRFNSSVRRRSGQVR